MKKKLAAIALTALLALGLFAGCKKTGNTGTKTPPTTSTVAQSETEEKPGTTEATEPATTEPEEPSSTGITPVDPGTAMTNDQTKEILAKTNAITQSEKNVDLDFLVDASVALKDENSTTLGAISMVISGSVQTNNNASRTTMTLSSNQLTEEMFVEVITIEKEDAIYSYTKENDQDYYTLKKMDKNSVAEATGNISQMFTSVADFAWDGYEADNAYVLTHEVTSEEAQKLRASISEIGTNLFSDTSADLTGTTLIYRIDKSSYMPLDLTMDMTAALINQTTGSIDPESIEKCSMILKMKINGYGTVGEITAPEHVLVNDDPTILTPPIEIGPTEGNGNWEDMKIVIDGVEYTVGDPYSKFEANGWTCDLSEYGGKDSTIEPGSVVTYYDTLYSEKYGNEYDAPAIGVMIANYSDEAKKLSDCSITQIAVSNEVGFEPKADRYEFYMACGLKPGMTQNEIYDLIGKPAPANVEASEILGYTSLTYEDVEKGYYMELTINGKDGLQEISLTIFD